MQVVLECEETLSRPSQALQYMLMVVKGRWRCVVNMSSLHRYKVPVFSAQLEVTPDCIAAVVVVNLQLFNRACGTPAAQKLL